MTVEIVKPTKEDYKQVNALAIQVHEMHVRWRPDLFNHVDTVITEEEFEEMLEKNELYVAKLKESIVGYMVISINERISKNPKIKRKKLLKIEAMCVDENHRGKGIGTQMLNFSKQIAKDNKCTDIHLTVNEKNTDAIKVYENFGMKARNISYSIKVDE